MLDTNICIYIIKKHPARVFEHFEGLAIGLVGISSITYSELLFGVANSSNPDGNRGALQTFLKPIEVWDYNAQAAQRYGPIRHSLTKKGNMIGPLDMLIAAHAKSLSAVLVTNNMREFKRVEDLSVENWTRP